MMEAILNNKILESDNIVLRATEPSDINLLYKWENDSEIWKVSNTITPYSRFLIEQYVLNFTQDILAAKQLRLMIDLKHENKTIGTADLFEYEPIYSRAGVGILILNEYRNKGYAYETLIILENYAKKMLNLNQLFCNIHENNVSSINLAEKAGYKNTGIKKQWTLNENGEWLDELFFQKML